MPDFLESRIATPDTLTAGELASLVSKQASTLEDVARYLERLNADVLTTTVVNGTASNLITDTRSHQVTFQVGGKAVPIYKLLAFSTYTVSDITINLTSQSNSLDGMYVASPPLMLTYTLNSIWMQVGELGVDPFIVNGPVSPTEGGFFLYGFTISDFDRKR